MTNHPPLGLVDVFAATLPKLKFAAGIHVNSPKQYCRCGTDLPS